MVNTIPRANGPLWGWQVQEESNTSQLADIMLDVKSSKYGAKGDGTTDDTTALQNAINDASSAGGGVVYLPQGTYLVSTLVVKSYVTIKGAGQDVTFINASTSSNAYLVTMPVGYVTQFHLRDLTFQGNANNSNQGCLYFYAKPIAPNNNGGVWYSTFKNIKIRNFTGINIWFRGGASGALLPHQFNLFENVLSFHSGTSTSRALKMTGQNGQFTFINCEFDGATTGTGTNIELGREADSSGNYTLGNNAPGIIDFINLTSQQAEKALFMDYCGNINVIGSWFENLYRAIFIQNNSTAINISKSLFANASSDGAGGGYAISCNSSSNVSGEGNSITGNMDKSYVNNSGVMNITNTNYNGTSLNTSGITGQLTAGATLTTGLNKTLLVNTSATAIATINSSLAPGETLTLIAWGGTVTLNNSGNIILSGATSLSLTDKQTVTLTRIDLGGTWALSGKGF